MNIDIVGTVFFSIALLHTFFVSYFAKLAQRFKEGSFLKAIFHLFSEVEVVFGFWSLIFLLTWSLIKNVDQVIIYQQSLNLTEPLFIFCVMIVASTRPIISFARHVILLVSRSLAQALQLQLVIAQLLVLLIVGPLLGSLITEPAAITITALLLYTMIDDKKRDEKLLYSLIAVLFVNVSVGGALTHFAAPPILIVARIWSWQLADVFNMLGLAAISAVFINAVLFIIIFRKKISKTLVPIETNFMAMPNWVTLTHIIFLFILVAASHYPNIFFGIFLIFMGLVTVTKKYQDQLKFKESLLVAFFLSGLIVFGSFQKWWLDPLLHSMNQYSLYFAAIGLTAITDNAALTYLGSQVPDLSNYHKWSLVSGALVGGGLTILANAPNPAGFSILSSKFPHSSLNAYLLFKAALLPTLVALICFYFRIFILSSV